MKKICNKCKNYIDINLMEDNRCPSCGASIEDSVLPAGTLISGFQIEEIIGRGGMGIVYKAKQLNLERYVALKILAEDFARNEAFVEQFFKEARAAASLSHQNIVQAFDAGATPDGIYYFAMELIEGETLERRIVREGCLEEKTCLDICIKIAIALDYAYSKLQLSHGDIKPENIILNSSGGAKLADLGLAKFAHDNSESELMATPLYAPPELIKGTVKSINHKTDMYSFGITIYQMLVGQAPYEDTEPSEVLEMHKNKIPAPLSERLPEISEKLSNFVDKLLAKSPSDRPDSWHDIVKNLEKTRHSLKKTKRHKRSFHITQDKKENLKLELSRKEKKTNPKKLIAILAGILLVLAVIAIAFRFSGSENLNFSATESGGDTEEASEDTLITEWKRVRINTNGLSDKKAIVEIEKYIEKYGENAPQEAIETAKIIKKRITGRNTRTRKRTEIRNKFKQDIENVMSKIRKSNFNNMSYKEIKKFSLEIDSILDRPRKHEFLNISGKLRNALNKASLDIGSIMVKKRKEKEAGEEAERKRKLKEAREKARKIAEQKRKTRENELSVNRQIALYYKTLAEFKDKSNPRKSPSYLVYEIKKLQDKISDDVKDYKTRIDFIVKNFESFPKLEKLFIRHPQSLMNKELPGIVGKKFPGYIVKKVNKNAVKAYITRDGLIGGKTFRWSQIPETILLNFAIERFIKPGKMAKLSESEKGSILFCLIMKEKNPQNFIRTVDKISSLNSSNLSIWKKLALDFSLCNIESNAAENIDKTHAFIEQKEYLKACLIYEILYRDLQNLPPAFENRYGKTLRYVREKLLDFSPLISAEDLYKKAHKTYVSKNYNKTLSNIMTADSRYCEGEHINKNLIQKINNLKDKTLDVLQSKSDIKSAKNIKIPFYTWSDGNPCDSYFSAQIIKNANPQSKALPFIFIGAEIEIGNWRRVKPLLEETLNFIDLFKNAKNKSWAPASLFAIGWAAHQYANNSASDILNMILDFSNAYLDKTKIKADSTCLAMELAIMMQKPENALAIAEKYNFNYIPPKFHKMNAKLGLLKVLSMINVNKSPEEIRKNLRFLKREFKVKGLNADYQYCDTALQLLSRAKNAILSDKKIKELKKTKLIFPDLSARILLSSVSRVHYQTGSINVNFNHFFQLIDSKLSLNTSNSDLWTRLFVYKAAVSHPNSWDLLIKKTLNDHRLAAMPFYNNLLIFRLANDLKNKKDNTEKLVYVYKTFSAASALSPSPKIKIENFIDENPRKSRKNIIQLYPQGKYETAFWLTILSVMNDKEKGIPKVFLQNFQLYKHSMRWEQKILLKKAVQFN